MKKRILIMALIAAPFLAVSVLFYAVVIGVNNAPESRPPARGAGANATGGANALGEWLASGARAETAIQRRGVEGKLDEAARAHTAERSAQPQRQMIQPERLEQGFVLVVRDNSDMSSDERPVYFASNITGWNAGDPRFILEPRSDMRWQIIFDEPIPSDGRVEFKFTLGSWDGVETDADGNDIPNRTLPLIDAATLAPGEKPVIEMEVVKFREPPAGEPVALRIDPYRPIDAEGTIRRLPVTGGAGGAFGLVRDLIVWLPQGYDDPANANRRYPVLYLFDGQNLFDQLPGVAGEWRADETATRLIAEGAIEPLIIVGVPHMERHRAEEYLPIEGLPGIEPAGDHFADWFVREVMPRAERAFRIDATPGRAAIGGASLGAVIALHIADRNPGLFGGLLLESMPILAGPRADDSAVRDMIRLGAFSNGAGEADPWRAAIMGVDAWPGRVVVGMGGREAGDHANEAELNTLYAKWARDLAAYIDARSGGEVTLLLRPEANHNENAWADRFPDALLSLFPAG